MPPIDTNWENYTGVVVGTYTHTLNFVLFLFWIHLLLFRLGWGTQFYTGPISHVLMKVEIPIWNNQACQDVYTANKIYDTVLCAGSSGKDSCQVRSEYFLV